jgi:glutathione S-transferase
LEDQLKLYQTYASPFPSRVRLLLYAKGIEAEIVEPPGFHSSAESKGDFKAFNPMERIPVLQLDDGRALPESEVICEYLEDAFPEPTLRPASPWERAQVRLIARICDIYLVMAMIPLFDALGQPRTDWNTDRIDGAFRGISKALDYLEEYIGVDGYAVGASLTQADGALLPQLILAYEWAPRLFGTESLLGTHPKLSAYWRAIQSDPISARIISETRDGIEDAIARRRAEGR